MPVFYGQAQQALQGQAQQALQGQAQVRQQPMGQAQPPQQQPPTSAAQAATPRETFLQRQNRVYGQQSPQSPVSSTGRMMATPPQGPPRYGERPPAGGVGFDSANGQPPQSSQPRGAPYAAPQFQGGPQAQGPRPQVGSWGGQQGAPQQQQQISPQFQGGAQPAQAQAYQPMGQAQQQQGGQVQQQQAPVYTQQPAQTQQAVQQAFQQPSAGTAPAGQVGGPAGGWATYQSQAQIPKAQQYAPGSQETYKAANIQQFQGPQQQMIQDQQQQMIQKLLANPYSMSAQGVDALKGQQAEQAMLMNKQQMGQMSSGLASRGIDPSSEGYGQMQQRQLGQDMSSKILDSNRNIDIQKMQTDRQDLLGALGAGTDFQNASLQRAISGYDTGLRGTEAQRAENLAQIGSGQDLTKLNWQGQSQGFQDQLAAAGMMGDEGYKTYGSQFAAQQADQARQQGNAGNALQGQSLAQQGQLQNRQMDLQNQQFGQSFGLQQQQFDYGKQQDAAQMQQQQNAAGAADDRWAEQQAYQYQLDQQQPQDQYLQWLMNNGGQ